MLRPFCASEVAASSCVLSRGTGYCTGGVSGEVGFAEIIGGVSDAVRAWCARGACTVRVLGLFRRPFHPEPIRGNGNASVPTRYHLQLLSP